MAFSADEAPETDHMIHNFTYDALPEPHYIRLLRLQPGLKTDGIICDLEAYEEPASQEVRRTDGERVAGYEALSWYWGEEIRLKPITVMKNGRSYTFQIRETLHAALSQLRLFRDPRLLWVDFICINQANEREKNRQVARMNEIYGMASSVCVWLGESDASSQAALRFISKKLSQTYMLNQLMQDPEHLSDWRAIVALMKKPWFNRRWVVQEIALARRATVHHGADFITWEELSSVISLMVDTESVISRLDRLAVKDATLFRRGEIFTEIPQLGATILVQIANRFVKNHAGHVIERTKSLEELMAWLPQFECRDPRDMVYALLALAKDAQPTTVDRIPYYLHQRLLTQHERKLLRRVAGRLPQGHQQPYPIRYDRDVVQVYQVFIKFVIDHAPPHRALDIVCRPFAQDSHWVEEVVNEGTSQQRIVRREKKIILPSWIPNKQKESYIRDDLDEYRTSAGNDVFYMQRERGDLFVGVPGSSGHYNASGESSRRRTPIFRRRGNKYYSMFVDGFVLDRIAVVHHRSVAGNIPEEWLKFGKMSPSRLNDFCRTLLAGRGARGYVPAFYIPTLKGIILQKKHGSIVAHHLTSQRESVQVETVFKHVIATISGRTLIQTRDHNFIGLAPGEAKEGDYVCILHGCSVPVILRRNKTEKDPALEAQQDLENFAVIARPMIDRLRDIRARRKAAGTHASTSGPNDSTNESESSGRATGLPAEAIADAAKVSPARRTSTVDTKASSNVVEKVKDELRTTMASVGIAVRRQSISMSDRLALRGTVLLASTLLMARCFGSSTAVAGAILGAPHVWSQNDGFSWWELACITAAASYVVTCFKSINENDLVVCAPFMASYATSLVQILLEAVAAWVKECVLPTLSFVWKRVTTLSAGLPHVADAKEAVAGTSANDGQTDSVPARTKTPDPVVVSQERMNALFARYTFELIGESYIDTMMNGEAIKVQNDSMATNKMMHTVTFELR